MQQRAKQNSKWFFTKAVILAVALVVGLIIFSHVSKNAVPRSFIDVINSRDASDRAQVLNEQQNAEIKKRCAGFWEYLGAGDKLQVYDGIELKDNGILWRVKQYWLALPSGDSVSLMHVMHGYVNPFAWKNLADSALTSEVRIVRQAMVRGRDTCFGECGKDELWAVQVRRNGIAMQGVEYSRYTGELSKFFPGNAIDIVDRIRYKDCPRNFSFLSFGRDAVAAEAGTQKAGTRDAETVQAFARTWYLPILRSSQPLSLMLPPPAHAPVRFTVLPEGGVTNVEWLLKDRTSTETRNLLTGYVASWRFPPAQAATGPVTVTCTIMPTAE